MQILHLNTHQVFKSLAFVSYSHFDNYVVHNKHFNNALHTFYIIQNIKKMYKNNAVNLLGHISCAQIDFYMSQRYHANKILIA